MQAETCRSTQIAGGYIFPEGARWFDDRLWFSDILSGRVFAQTASGYEAVAEFDGPVSGIGFLADGTAVASLMRDRRLERIGRDGRLSTHADLSVAGYDHINDVVSDAAGRIYVDCLRYRMEWLPPERHGATTIFRYRNHARGEAGTASDDIVLVEPDGSWRVVAERLHGPNGLAISGDGRRLLVAEWRANRIVGSDIASDGSLAGARTVARLDTLPDGICLDVEGAIWVACPQLGECRRISPSGELLAVVRTAGRRVTACVLGGPGRETLFLTADDMPELGTGRLESVAARVPGAGYP